MLWRDLLPPHSRPTVKIIPKPLSALFLCLFCANLAILTSSCGDSSGSDDETEQVARENDDRPDLILITIDGFRPDRSPVYGYELPTTPALEQLAAESLVFDRAYTNMPLSLPAHASMLTGLPPATHGVRDDIECSLQTEHSTLPKVLRKEGYRTGAFVGSLNLHRKFALNRGFAVYDDAIKRRASFGNDPSSRSGDEVVRVATEWLEESDGNPSFLLLNLSEPNATHDFKRPTGEGLIDDYDSKLLAADLALGAFLDRLRELGRFDNSWILVTSGSGEALGDHGEQGHGYLLHEPTIRIPLVLKTPGRSETARVGTPVALTDIAATFFAASGVKPFDTKGKDLIQIAAEPEPNRPIYCESIIPTRYERSPFFSLIVGNWKLIHSSAPELYDLDSDPLEMNNLAAEETSRTAELEAQLALVRGDGELKGPSPKEFLEEHLLISTFPETLEAGYPDDVAAACDAIEAEHPGLRVTAYYRTLIEIQGHDFDRSHKKVEALKRFLSQFPIRRRPVKAKLDPYASSAGFSLGMELSSTNRGSEAIYPLRDALLSRPYEATGHMAIGDAFLQNDRIKTGIKSLEIAANIAPTGDLENTLGFLHQDEGNDEKSHAHFLNAVQFNPNNATFHANLGRSHSGQFEWPEAVASLRRSLELNPKQAEVELELGFILATTNDQSVHDIEAALKCIERALELDLSLTPQTLEGVAAVYAEAEYYDLAIRFLNKAVFIAEDAGDLRTAALLNQKIDEYQYEANLQTEE